MQVPVLQVPAGEEGGPGGYPNLLKEEEHEKESRSRSRRWRGRGGKV